MELYQYDIFRTQWGWFGLLDNGRGLMRTCLPVAHKEAVKNRMLSDIPDAKHSKKTFSTLKKAIKDYYKGTTVDFREVRVCLEDLSEFQQKVLTALRSVTYGNRITYGQLAELAGSPRGGRAVGTVLAENPLPLIIPCHRVIKSDGAPGFFSAAGGTQTKIRMLKMENPTPFRVSIGLS